RLSDPPNAARAKRHRREDSSKLFKRQRFTSSIDNFRLLWFDRLELGGLSVTDPEGNEMLSAQSVLINFNLAELLNERDINVDAIVLDSAVVHLSRIALSDTTTDLNINIFVSELNKLSR